MPHHPRKAYPSRSRGRLTGPVMGKHKTADAPGGARKAWPELYTAGRLFNGEYRKQHHRALQSIPQNPLRKARQPDRHALPRGVHQAARPSAERQDADPPAEERHRLPRFSHIPHADRQGREESASQEHRQHEAQDPQVPRAGGLRQDDTRQRRAILRELDGPHLTRQHLPPAAEHGRLFLQLFPGAQTITERRHNSWPKN